MRFSEFSNYKDHLLLYEHQKNKDFGAKDSYTKPDNYPDHNYETVIDNDEQPKAPAVTIINKYKPDKSVSENTEGFTKWDPIADKAVAMYMDYSDMHTINILNTLNEAEQNSLLLNLTNKLYQMIINKIDSIDFGEIPNTKGDITKLRHYDELIECHKVLRNIFKEYREDVSVVQVLEDAVTNIEEMKDIFTAGFYTKTSLVISTYNTMTLSVINATSFMIATCIEYIKNPNADGLHIVLDKTGIAKTKDHLVYETLKDFNDSCSKGEVQGALKPLVKQKAKGFAMSTGLILGIKAALVIGTVAIAIIPMIRNLVYFFYSARTRVSTYFDAQAKLLEMNANELENNPEIKTEDDKKEVIRRQLAIASSFRTIANAVAVDSNQAAKESHQEVKKDNKEYKIDDLEPTITDSGSDGPLF